MATGPEDPTTPAPEPDSAPVRRRDLRRNAARAAGEAGEATARPSAPEDAGAAVAAVDAPARDGPVTQPTAAEPAWADEPAGEPASIAEPVPTAERVVDEPARPSRSVPPGGRSHRRSSIIGVILAVAIVLGLGVLILSAVRPRLPEGGATPSTTEAVQLDYPGPGSGEVLVTIPADADATAIGTVLVDSGVVLTVEGFEAAYAANPGAASIQPGSYRLLGQMTSKDAITALLDPARRQDLQLTIPTGYRTDQIYARVADVLGVPVDDVRAAAQDYAALGIDGSPNTADGVFDPLEGWLLAGTYTVSRTSTPTEVLRQMYDATIAQLDALGVVPEERARILTIASIAGKEAHVAEDFPRVTRVIVNRLAVDSPTDGRIQMDSTLTYAWAMQHLAVEEMDPALHDTDPSPYNTRLLAGLPPSPIGSVDAVLLNAAVSPEEGPWIYFVETDLCSGQLTFTDSYDEIIARQKELREWIETWEAGGEACPTPEG